MIKIDESVLGVDTATFDFATIASTYSHLVLVINSRSDKAAVSDDIGIRFNNDSGSNYDWKRTAFVDSTSNTGGEAAGETSMWGGYVAADSAPANVADQLVIWIADYKRTTFKKNVTTRSSLRTGSTAGTSAFYTALSSGWWNDTSAITRVTVISRGSGNFRTGSVATLYGLS